MPESPKAKTKTKERNVVCEGISSCSRKAASEVARRKIGEAGDVASVCEIVAQVFVAFQLFCKADAVSTTAEREYRIEGTWTRPHRHHVLNGAEEGSCDLKRNVQRMVAGP